MNGGGDLVLVRLELGVESGVEDGGGEGLVACTPSLGGGGSMGDCGAHGDHVLRGCSLRALLTGWSAPRLVLLLRISTVRVLRSSVLQLRVRNQRATSCSKGLLLAKSMSRHPPPIRSLLPDDDCFIIRSGYNPTPLTSTATRR